MGDSFFAMNPELVESTGGKVHALEPTAHSAVQSVLTGYTTGSGDVVHPKVSAALARFHDTHQATHRAVPHAVSTLGANTAKGAKAVADGSNESASVQMGSLATSQGAVTSLRRLLAS